MLMSVVLTTAMLCIKKIKKLDTEPDLFELFYNMTNTVQTPLSV